MIGKKQYIFNSVIPGSVITIIPIKPTTTANHRYIPTFSLRNSIEKIVVKIGVANEILTTVARGNFLSAIKIAINEIIPAVEFLKTKGLNIVGPISPDIIFREAVKKKFDLVIANYHDQGHIPVKLLYFDQSVNVTLGVPFIRTSVDH